MLGRLRRARLLPRLLLGLCLVLPVPGCTPGAEAQLRLETFSRDEVAISTADGRIHRFQVELALTPAQQSQGLMYRRTLAEDGGMLFLYERDWPASMWMKNTLIPLDMLFIGRDGRIVHAVERTVPGSLAAISADRPVAAVLELNAGTVSRLGIEPGDRVVHRAFGSP